MSKNQIAELEARIAELEAQLVAKSTGSRASTVLELLNEGPISVTELAIRSSMNKRQISAILTQLRNKGYTIFTDDQNRKILMNSEPGEPRVSKKQRIMDEVLLEAAEPLETTE